MGRALEHIPGDTKEGFHAGMPKLLFEGRYEKSPIGPQPGIGYDVSPDGKRFRMIKSLGEQNASTQLHLVHNWFEELHRRVPTEAK